MKPTLTLAILVTTLSLMPAHADKEEDFARLKTLPMSMPDFRMEDITGKEHRLSDYADSRLIVIFLQMNGCPIVRQSFPYLEELRQEYEKNGVKFLMINCNNFDDNQMVNEEAKEYGIKMPILMDHTQVFANALHVMRSAETIVVDPKDWSIVYRGMADDRFDYGLQRPNPTNFWLHDILEGKTPEESKRITRGCLMDIVPLPQLQSFEKEVAPVLEKTFGDCAESINEDAPDSTRKLLWDALLLQRSQFTHCEGKTVDIEPYDALTLMSWLGPYPFSAK